MAQEEIKERTPVHIMMPVWQKRALKRLAAKNGASMSEEVIAVLSKHIEANKDAKENKA